MKQFIKAQFHYSKICFDHNDWRIFVYCPWLPRSFYQLIYLAYRWIVCLYFLAWLGYAGYQSNINHGNKYPIFITAWTFVLLNAYLLLTAIVCTYKYITEIHLGRSQVSMLQTQDLKDPSFLQCCLCCAEKCSVDSDNDEDEISTVRSSIPWYIKIVWLLYTWVSQASILVVVLYWGTGIEVINWPLTLHEHLFTLVPVFVDIFITSYPIRFYHFIYSSLLGSVYIMFTIIYYAAGGTNSKGEPYVYSLLDYGESPVTAIGAIIMICVIAPILLNSFYWLLYLLRTYLVYHKVSIRLLRNPRPSETALYTAKRSDSTIEMVEADSEKTFSDDEDGNVVSSVTLTLDKA